MRKLLFFMLLSPAITSCLNRHFVDGWPELVSVRDTLMNDSCIIYGYAGLVDNEFTFITEFDVVLEDSGFRTTSDSSGYYSIKTLPGVCSVSCEIHGNTYDRLKETIRFIAPKNKKIRVDFHIGYAFE